MGKDSLTVRYGKKTCPLSARFLKPFFTLRRSNLSIFLLFLQRQVPHLQGIVQTLLVKVGHPLLREPER